MTHKLILTFAIGFLFLQFQLVKAQTVTYETKEQNIEVKGYVIENEWTKSSESYCAGGSAYFSLVDKNNQVLHVFKSNHVDLLLKWAGSKRLVVCKGDIVLKTSTYDLNNEEESMLQRPVEYSQAELKEVPSDKKEVQTEVITEVENEVNTSTNSCELFDLKRITPAQKARIKN